MENNVCIIASARDELPFIDEWIAYHKIIGFDHIYLYDDDPNLPLKEFLKPHGDFVTVIDWYEYQNRLPGDNRQLRCYNYAIKHIDKKYNWVCFLDCDEFITLKKYENVKVLLEKYKDHDSLCLFWHLFGHNGYYSNPKELVTKSLIKRKSIIDENAAKKSRFKCITKVNSIALIDSVHYCILNPGKRKTMLNDNDCCVNHYMCRSFETWMKRPKRGNMFEFSDHLYPGEIWKATEGGCLKYFVEVIASVANEVVDNFMLKFTIPIQDYLEKIKNVRVAERSKASDCKSEE